MMFITGEKMACQRQEQADAWELTKACIIWPHEERKGSLWRSIIVGGNFTHWADLAEKADVPEAFYSQKTYLSQKVERVGTERRPKSFNSRYSQTISWSTSQK